MARKFAYKGKPIEELKQMTLEEFTRIIPAHARRTLKRMGLQVRKFLQKFRHHKASNKPMKTHFRQMVIIPEMVGFHVLVHNGNSYKDLLISQEMLGKKLGELSITTKLVKHSGPGIGATRGSKTVELK